MEIEKALKTELFKKCLATFFKVRPALFLHQEYKKQKSEKFKRLKGQTEKLLKYVNFHFNAIDET